MFPSVRIRFATVFLCSWLRREERKQSCARYGVFYASPFGEKRRFIEDIYLHFMMEKLFIWLLVLQGVSCLIWLPTYTHVLQNKINALLDLLMLKGGKFPVEGVDGW